MSDLQRSAGRDASGGLFLRVLEVCAWLCMAAMVALWLLGLIVFARWVL